MKRNEGQLFRLYGSADMRVESRVRVGGCPNLYLHLKEISVHYLLFIGPNFQAVSGYWNELVFFPYIEKIKDDVFLPICRKN